MDITAQAVHQLSALVWVGGMFFAIMVLRLAAGELEPPVRAPLWGRVFARFFPWVWVSVILLPVSGYWLVFSVWGSFAELPLNGHLMQGLGWVMIVIYLYLWFGPYRQFREALQETDFPRAGSHLNRIRQLVTTNLVIGLINAIVGSTGRYW